jgi:hypothetical protein
VNLRLGRLALYAMLFVALAAILAAWNHYRSSRDLARDAVVNLAECERLTQELDRFRDAPRIASLEVEPPDRIAARVTSAAAGAMLSPLSIYSVDPQTPSRIARSAYQIRATQIVLQNATLRQIASFVSGLEDSDSGMIVRDLSLSGSKTVSDDDSELWNARLTLTQMIYSPISDR